METLFKGREVLVTFEDGGTETVKVRQLPMRDYAPALAVAEDELKLTSLICGKPPGWSLTLDPESYEALRVVALEVNEKGFFSFARRQSEKMFEQLNRMNPEVAKLAAETGARVLSDSARASVPRPQ